MSDALAVVSGSLPRWCESLAKSCPVLFPFEVRKQLFSARAFGSSRSIVWMQTKRDVEAGRTPGASGGGDGAVQEFQVGRQKHERVRVPRSEDELFAWARQVLLTHADHKSVLEIEFQGEPATGLGPSLEFYSLVCAEFQRRDFALWLCDDVAGARESARDLGRGAKPRGRRGT